MPKHNIRPYISFQIKVARVHRGLYTYDKASYKGLSKKVRIFCKEHGEFWQHAGNHINLKQKCPTCAKTTQQSFNTKRKLKARDSFIERATNVHDGRYTYDKVVYTTDKSKVIITCKVHGDFTQQPNGHITSKQGCKECYNESFKQSNNSEFNDRGWRLFFKNRRTTLYYIRFTYHGKYYYKIGITTKTVAQRFAGEPIPYEILFERSYKSGQTAYKKEQDILNKYKKHRYCGPNILRSGNSELHVKNIMKGTK